MQCFINDDDNDNNILFKITLHPGDSGVSICQYSEYPDESEILIAASSGFKIEEVEYIDYQGNGSNSLRIP
jgi:hypothetical protein